MTLDGGADLGDPAVPRDDSTAQQAAGLAPLLLGVPGRARGGGEQRLHLRADGLHGCPPCRGQRLLPGGPGVFGPLLGSQPRIVGALRVLRGRVGLPAGGGAGPGSGPGGLVGPAAQLVEFLPLPVDLGAEQSLDGALEFLSSVFELLLCPPALLAPVQGRGVRLVALPGDAGQVVHLGRRGDERRRPGAQDALGIAALLDRDGSGRGHLLVQGPQVLPLAVEAFEALGQFGDLAPAERGQGPGEQGGQQRRVQPLGQFGGAELEQRGDQGVVALLTQPGEERAADRAAVVGR